MSGSGEKITLNVLSLGAGVQSSTLLEMSLLGELPRYDLVLFADTGNEPRAVYNHVRYLQSKALAAGIDFRLVSKGTRIQDDAHSGKFYSMPLWIKYEGRISAMRRQCTIEYKITPTDSEILGYLLERGWAKRNTRGLRRVRPGVRVNVHLGISTDEEYRVSESETRWKIKRYPLIEMGIDRVTCVRWLKSHSVSVPSKSSCKICPYHEDDYWLSLDPDEFEECCQFDDYIRTPEFKQHSKIVGDAYLHRSGVPLREVVLVERVKSANSSLQAETIYQTCGGDKGYVCWS